MGIGQTRGQPPESLALGAGQRDGTNLFDHGDGRQEDFSRPQFVRDRVREHHSLGRLQGQGHQPIDQCSIVGPVELPQFKPIEQLLQVFAPGLIAPCVLSSGRRPHLQLCGDDSEQWGKRRLVLREHPARMA